MEDLEAELLSMAKAHPELTVYFMRSGPFLKVGSSRQVWKRIWNIRVGSPMPVWLAGLGSRIGATEEGIQADIAQYRHSGEWHWFTRYVWQKVKPHAVIARGMAALNPNWFGPCVRVSDEFRPKPVPRRYGYFGSGAQAAARTRHR